MRITIMTPEIKDLEAKAAAWERRCEELEQENRELREDYGREVRRRQEACVYSAEKELEVREMQEMLDKASAASGLGEAHLQDRIRNLQRVISDQNDEIAQKHEMVMATSPIWDSAERLKEENEQLKAEVKRLREHIERHKPEFAVDDGMNEVCKRLRDQLAEKKKECEMREAIEQERKRLCEGLQDQLANKVMACKVLEMRENALNERLDDAEAKVKAMRDRIGELDFTVALYDDENRRLKEQVANMPVKDGLNDWARRIHESAVKHGWWESEAGKFDDGDRPFPEIVALCHSELSEALEEYRNKRPMAYQVDGTKYYPALNRTEPNTVEDVCKWRDDKKLEGIAVEMIDCMIRILDWCGHEGIDVDTLMEKKVKYNKKRPYRHGGKKA